MVSGYTLKIRSNSARRSEEKQGAEICARYIGGKYRDSKRGRERGY